MSKQTRVLKTIERVYVLKNLHPEHLAFLSQYYFLENLALPMVIDDLSESSSYACLLCHNWYRPDPNTWKFFIRKNLKFSDGTPITIEMIFKHYQRIQKTQTLHLNFIKDAKISILQKQHALVFRFPYPLQDEFLYELSLPDGAFLHPKNLKQNWSVTAGAYFVKKIEKDESKAILKANSYYPLSRPKRPTQVEIYRYHHPSLKKDFKKFQINFLSSALSTAIPKKYFRKVATRLWRSYPCFSIFFTFCSEKKRPPSKKLRKAFQALVQLAAHQIKDPHFHPDFQIIPKGYPSRVVLYVPPKGDLRPLKGKTIHLLLGYEMKQYPNFKKSLQTFAKQNKIQLKFHLSKEVFPDSFSKSYFVRSIQFKANQKDPTSIWSYLLRAPLALKCFKKTLQPLFKKALSAPSRELKWYHLQKLHQKVIEENMLIPIGFEPIEFYTDSNVFLDRFNPFDMRPRYYEVMMEKNNFFSFFKNLFK